MAGRRKHSHCSKANASITHAENSLSCSTRFFLQDVIFAEAYGGLRLPFSPVKFLDTWWRSAGGSLAGYQQQDAHEFYLSLLDGLSQPLDRSTTPSASGSPSARPRAKSLTPTSAGRLTVLQELKTTDKLMGL